MRILKKCLKGARVVLTWLVSSLFPIDNKKIVLSSYYGRGYGDNPKYIAEELIKLGKDLKIIWLVKDDKDAVTLPAGICGVKTYSTKGIFHLCTAKVWVDNCRKGFLLFKRKKQIYIQTWHGFALKRIEKDVESALDRGYVRGAKRDSKYIDYIISDSEFMTNIYKSAFWYDKEIKQWGSPRNDIVINGDENVKDKVFGFFGLSDDTMTVLYAPTFRVDMSIEAYSLDYERARRVFEKRFNKKVVILVRLHPNVVEKSENLAFDGQIINASYYPDMQELLSSCDVVISDYSSLMFDFALSRKPCFQFATDIDDYKNDRNFYFEINNLPFPLAQSNDELESRVEEFDQVSYLEKLNEFYDSVGMVIKGDAAAKCAELICESCKDV